jgi:hypothetical protein
MDSALEKENGSVNGESTAGRGENVAGKIRQSRDESPPELYSSDGEDVVSLFGMPFPIRRPPS